MRVVVAAHRLAPPRPSGVDRYVRALTGALADLADLEVAVGSASEPDAVQWLPSGVSAHRVRGPRRAVLAGWCFLGRPRVDAPFGQPDVVHVAVPAFPVPSSCPVVYSFHDVFPMERPAWYGRQARWAFRRALAAAIERDAPVITFSAHTARALAGVGVDPALVNVIPHGVDPRFTAPVGPADLGRVAGAAGAEPGGYDLVVGAISRRKNVTVLVRAAAADNRCPIVVAGVAGVAARELQAEIERRGVGDLIRLVGFVNDADLPALLQGARALLHPSIDEGFGLTALEAMAAGTPAVVADAGALPEVVGDAALRVDPHDVDGWVAARASLEDPALRRRLTAAGAARAGLFTWSATAEATVAVYRRAVARG